MMNGLSINYATLEWEDLNEQDDEPILASPLKVSARASFPERLKMLTPHFNAPGNLKGAVIIPLSNKPDKNTNGQRA